MRLHVDAGSLAETESERGMAHFLEHMAFNGSENFEAGTLVEWFQENGMSFGADTNAHTHFSETVYQLDLPNRDEETLREGFTVLCDYAAGLLLLEEEVQNEKGVIDGEERERDSAGYRAFEQLVARQYAGTRLAIRLPIGTKEARDAFTSQSVRAFYERWYRPENMTLVVVGDLRDFDPTPLIVEFFGKLRGPGTPVAPEPPLGEPAMEDLLFAIPEEEIPIAQVSLSNLKPWVDRLDTIANRRANVTRQIAQAMLNLRYEEAVKEPETPFLQAQAGDAGGMRVFEGGDLTVISRPDAWQEALTAAILELREVLEFGFHASELDEVRAQVLRNLDEAVEREPKVDSAVLREALLLAAEKGDVPSNAATDRAIVRPLLEALTVEDCQQSLGESWAEGMLAIVAIGSMQIGDPESELAAVYDAAMAVELAEPEAVVVKPFAYDSDPEAAGEIESREEVEDLELTQVCFANGVQLNVKATDFEEREILVRVRVGDGRLGLEEDQLASAWIANHVFIGGGLGEHDADDLRRLNAGRQVGVSMTIEEDHFLLSGATTAEDLLRQLELMAAYLADPGYRPDALVPLRVELPLLFEQYKHTPDGPIEFQFLPRFFLGNPRVELLNMSLTPSLEELSAVGMEEVQALLAPSLAQGAIEITLVGDLDLEAALREVGQTFGALAPRAPAPGLEAHRKGASLAVGLEVRATIDTEDEKATLLMLFPTTDGYDRTRRRNLYFLGRVVDDRLRVEVRERLGAAYSPFAVSQASRVFEGVGALMLQAAGHPSQVEELIAACKAVAADLAEKGVGEEEVQRLKEPILNELRDAKRTNPFWLSLLDTAQSEPESLDDLRGLVEFYEKLDPEALSALCAQFFEPQRASFLVVLPEAVEEDGWKGD